MIRYRVLLLIVLLSFFSKLMFSSNGDTLMVNPNPFDSVTVIHFEIANNDTVSLDIYNAWGQTIKTYYNSTVLSSGSYTINFNGDTLPNGIYFVRLKVNSTKTFNVKLIKVTNAVGLKENSLPENILIYPNPTSSILNISDEQNQLQNATIEIKNCLGQLVYTSHFTSQIDLHCISAGIYYLTIQYKEDKRTVRIIRNNNF